MYITVQSTLHNYICERVQLAHKTENTFSNTRRTTVNDSIVKHKTSTTSHMQIMYNSKSIMYDTIKCDMDNFL